MNQNERIENELLVIRAQEGSVEALSELVERWQDRLWRLAWRLTDDEQAAGKPPQAILPSFNQFGECFDRPFLSPDHQQFVFDPFVLVHPRRGRTGR